VRVDLEGKVAVVTGGVRNIGRAIATALADSGAHVAVTYSTDKAAADDTVADLSARGVRVAGYRTDARDVDRLQTTLARVANDLGPVSVLVNNAAIRPAQKIAEIRPADFDDVVAVNLRGPFFAAQAVLPGMRAAGWGRIVNISGGTAYFGGVKRAHVVATKLGLVGLSRALALEVAGWGVTVNTVVPGAIGGSKNSGAGEAHLERVPAGRRGTPEEIAAAVLYLCSPEAGYVTAQELLVTGGQWPLQRQPWNEY
jgi:3-oxoacyl-[acyl-carrier protein] reductase